MKIVRIKHILGVVVALCLVLVSLPAIPVDAVDALTITSVSPDSGAPGTSSLSVTITGTGFTGITSVGFTDSQISLNHFIVNSSTQITAVISIPTSAGASVCNVVVNRGSESTQLARSFGITCQITLLVGGIRYANVVEGSAFKVRVNTTKVNNLSAFMIYLTYNPDILEMISAEGGSAGVSPGLIGSTPFPIEGWAYFPLGLPGTIAIQGRLPLETAPHGATGPGYLCEANFRVKSGTIGQTSNLIFSNLGLGFMGLFNSDSYTLKLADPQNGSVNVVPGPTILLTSTVSSPTKVSPLPVTVTFSESIYGFTLDDVVLGNCTASGFSGGPRVFTFNVTPWEQGNVTVDIPDNVAVNIDGYPNTSASQLIWVYDTLKPGVNITSPTSPLTKVTPIPVTVTFSENVFEFIAADIATNGTVSGFTGGGSTYTANITPAGQGAVTVNILDNVARDAAGNYNTASTTFTRTFDSVSPAVSAVNTGTADGSYPVGTVINFTVTFSETVIVNQTGGTPSLSLNSGGVANYVSGSNSNTLTFRYTVGANQNAADLCYTSTSSLTLNGATIRDPAGNNASMVLPATTTFASAHAIVIDTVVPAVSSFTSTQANGSYNAGDVIDFRITYNDAVFVNTTGGTPRFALNSGGYANYYSGSSSTILVFRYIVADGETSADLDYTATNSLTANLNGGTIRDAAGNNAVNTLPAVGTFAGSHAIVIDTTRPSVVFSSTASDPTKTSPIPVTVVFSENVTGLLLADFVVNQGTKSSFASSNPKTYSFKITPTAQGLVTVNLPENQANDAAGNGNTAAAQFSLTFDNVSPTIALTTTAQSPTGDSPFYFTATFSEPVTGFNAGDVTVTRGTPGSMTGGPQVYNFIVTPSGSGVVTVYIPGGKCADLAGNSNGASPQVSITYDSTAPRVTAVNTAKANGRYSVGAIIDFTVTYSEAVTVNTGGGIPSIALNSAGTAVYLSGSGSAILTFRYTVAAGESSADLDYTSTGALTLNGGTIKDGAGINASNALPAVGTFAVAHAIVIDAEVPTVVLASTAAPITRTSPIPLTATFSENVSGFTLTDISVVNGTAANLTGGPTIFNFTVTPSAQGAVTVNIPAGMCVDSAGNGNLASNQLIRTYDSVAPAVNFTPPPTSPTSISPIVVTAVFNEDVTGFISGDILVTNGTVGNFAGGPRNFVFNVIPGGPGVVAVNIPAGAAQDAAGNNSLAPATLNISFDNQAPAVVLSSTTGASTNVTPIPVTATFSEPVSGFTAGDITVSNGSVSGFAGGPQVFTFNVTPQAQGIVTVDVAAGAAQDAAGNGNTAAAQLVRTFSTSGPTVVLSSVAADPTRFSPIPVTATFNINVLNFVAGDVSVSNGAVSNFSGSGSVYTFNVIPSGQGTVTVNIPAGVANDSAGNVNAAALPLSRVFDNVSPIVSLSPVTPVANPTNLSSIAMTAIFSEDVTGLLAGEISVTNGTASAFAGGPRTYTFTFSPSAQGPFSVNIAAGVASDAAGNTNTAATVYSLTYDSLAPVVSTVGTAKANGTYGTGVTIDMTVTYNEAVTLDTTGGSPSLALNSGGNALYTGGSGTSTLTFRYTVAADQASADLDYTSTGSLALNGSAIRDLATNTANNTLPAVGTFAAAHAIVIDSVAPALTLTSAAPPVVNTSPILVTATFSENVTGLTLGEITVGNGTASNLGGGPKVFTFNVIPGGQGTVTVDIAANKAQDTAGNGNTAAAQLSRVFDNQAPTVSLATTATEPTNVSPIPVTATFSEDVTGFTLTDITVTNGTAGGLSSGPRIYTFNVTPSSQGTVIISIAAGVAQDAAGNNNTAATPLSRTFSSVSPTVTLSSAAPAVTNASVIPVTATFSTDVTGFTLVDILVGNGTASGLSGGNRIYTFNVAPAGQGLVTVNIPAGAAQDNAGNGNAAAVQLSRTYDSVGPTVSLAAAASGPTNTATIAVTMTFNEDVTGFVAGDLAVGNGSLSGFSGGPRTYTVNVTASGQGAVTVGVPQGAATDAAGNASTAATPAGWTYDTVAPVIMGISTGKPDGTYTIGEIIDIAVTYGETVIVNTSGGIPQITLNSGGFAIYYSGSGSAILVFRYTVAAGQNSSDLDYTTSAALMLHGGTIKDAATNNAAIALPAVGTIASTHAIVIDTTNPVVGSASPSQALQGVTLNLVVTGSHLSGATALNFSGTGITVNSLTVNSSTELVANITISFSAAPGTRSITVTTGTGTSAPLAGGFTVILRGDADGNGMLGIGDVITVERMMLGLVAPNLAADANGDGIIGIADVIVIELIMLDRYP